jgi:hypothetical protein
MNKKFRILIFRYLPSIFNGFLLGLGYFCQLFIACALHGPFPFIRNDMLIFSHSLIIFKMIFYFCKLKNGDIQQTRARFVDFIEIYISRLEKVDTLHPPRYCGYSLFYYMLFLSPYLFHKAPSILKLNNTPSIPGHNLNSLESCLQSKQFHIGQATNLSFHKINHFSVSFLFLKFIYSHRHLCKREMLTYISCCKLL